MEESDSDNALMLIDPPDSMGNARFVMPKLGWPSLPRSFVLFCYVRMDRIVFEDEQKVSTTINNKFVSDYLASAGV
jgi:hypothetical protein